MRFEAGERDLEDAAAIVHLCHDPPRSGRARALDEAQHDVCEADQDDRAQRVTLSDSSSESVLRRRVRHSLCRYPSLLVLLHVHDEADHQRRHAEAAERGLDRGELNRIEAL